MHCGWYGNCHSCGKPPGIEKARDSKEFLQFIYFPKLSINDTKDNTTKDKA